jgi:predicted transglutaminase-like cysteine proteinase
MKFCVLLLVASGLICGAATAGSRPILQETRMAARGMTEAPIGFVRFCYRNPSDCREPAGSSIDTEVTLNKRRLDELIKVNETVNRTIKPVSDEIQYKAIEHWTYPTSGKGDCEDYVLLKKRELIALGWPAAALLITVVRDENDEGHAVLTARTDHGDLILDNKHSEIKDWQRTHYIFIKRQSSADPKRWDSLIPQGGTPTVAASGYERAP